MGNIATAESLMWTRERSGFWTARSCVGLYSVILTDDGYAYSIGFDELGHIGHNADVYPHDCPFSCAKASAEADYAARLAALGMAPRSGDTSAATC